MPVKYGTKPFQHQVDFFRRKLNIGTRGWTDLWQGQHDHAFMVAGAMKADLVEDLRQAVQKSIEQGTTLAEFRKDFDVIVQKNGWGYKGGRNWRTRVIFETNLRTSYQAGRYKQMKEIAQRRPYWRYTHSPFVKTPRPEHEGWDGLILKHDDPWWETHYPPNGWGCRCSVETLAERDMAKLGKTRPDQAPPVERATHTVGKRSAVQRTVEVPKGIDPGWAYAPGQKYAQLLEAAAAKSGAMEFELGALYVQEIVASGTFLNWYKSPVGNFPIARLPDAQAEAIGANARYAVLSSDTADKQKRRHPEISANDYRLVQQAVMGGERIPDGSDMIYIYTVGDVVVVIKATRTGNALYLTSLRKLSAHEAKRSKEIERLRKKQDG